jgi:rhodanese-related sulfurtransferase
VALLLIKNGIARVRPLAGGIDAWRERNLPVHPRDLPAGEPAKI